LTINSNLLQPICCQVREQLLQSLPEVREQLLQSLHEQLSNFLCFTQEERVYNYEDPTARKTMQVDTCVRTLFNLYSLSLSLLWIRIRSDPELFGLAGSRSE
jgi:hypothetical protein